MTIGSLPESDILRPMNMTERPRACTTIVLILSERNRPAEIPMTLPAIMAPVFTIVPVNSKPL